MKCIKNNAENVSRAIEILKSGGVVAHPADTCFGLAGDLMKESALEKLQKIKGRDANKPMSIMLPPFMKPILGEFAELNEFSEMVCDKLLPGPVTIILPKGPKIPDYFFPELSTVGVRIPYSTNLNDLMLKYYHPLITTSANLTGQPVCSSCEDVVAVFEDQEHFPDLFLEGDIHGPCLPSTVIALENDQIKILREGPMKKEQLEAILGLSVG